MAKKDYVQKLSDFFRPSNQSTNGTSPHRVKNFFNETFGLKQNRKSKNPNQASLHTEAVAEPSTNNFPRFPELPTELRENIIQHAIPKVPQLRLVNHEFDNVVQRNELNELRSWKQALDRAEEAISDSNVVRAALPDCDPATLSNLDTAADILTIQIYNDDNPHRPRLNIPIDFKKVAEALINIANNGGANARFTAFGGLGEILKMKDRSPGAARIAAWGLRELSYSPRRETDYRGMRDHASRHLLSFTQSLTGNERKCIEKVLKQSQAESSTAAQPSLRPLPSSPVLRQPTTQILLSALKRPAKKTYKRILDTLRRGRYGGDRP